MSGADLDFMAPIQPEDGDIRGDFEAKATLNLSQFPSRRRPVVEVRMRALKPLSRHGWLFFRETVSRSKSAIGSVRVNVAMKCKWKSGESLIDFIVESFHNEESGASGVTRLHRFLNC